VTVARALALGERAWPHQKADTRFAQWHVRARTVQAQTLRDLAELSIDIYTAPPGAINLSNTASAFQVALDSLGTWAVTGIPGPAATGLTQAVKYVKNRKTRARITAALQGRTFENEATP
jgi:ABC-type Fe2+-enterobactin transport system substrate-binding protein